MAIEIRELLIKVKIEDAGASSSETMDMEQVKRLVQKACRKEIKKQLSKYKER